MSAAPESLMARAAASPRFRRRQLLDRGMTAVMVIATLRGEMHAEVDGYEGLRSLEVVIAAYRSARDGVREAEHQRRVIGPVPEEPRRVFWQLIAFASVNAIASSSSNQGPANR